MRLKTSTVGIALTAGSSISFSFDFASFDSLMPLMPLTEAELAELMAWSANADTLDEMPATSQGS